MDRRILFKPVVYLAIFISMANWLGEKFYWYYSDFTWWFDMLMHFGGGFWQGIFFLWFFSAARLPFLRRPIGGMSRQTLGLAILFVLFIGVSWEAGEFLTTNYIGREPWSGLDTFSDILFDLAGGALALSYSVRRIMPPRLFKV